MKNKTLNQWLWKWHVIAGLVSLPVVLLLSVTGVIYLFKQDYESRVYRDLQQVEPTGTALSFEDQLARARASASSPITKLVVPDQTTEATRFVSGERSKKRTVHVNPYSGEVTGEVVQAQTFMHKVRKLHGEILLGKGGTMLVELIASWLVVLILTGLYVWWPAERWRWSGFFTIRRHHGRRIFLRDLHAVGGFWLSLMLLVILAGGMPWTDVFGAQLKRVQKWTGSGYPSTWSSARGIESTVAGEPLDLDQMVAVARKQELPGTVEITLPKSPEAAFTVSNRSLLLRDQEVHHFDQYSGAALKSHSWSEVGAIMNGRQVFMRIHQGEYGTLNWILVLLTGIAFFFTSLSALASYWLRKPKGRWGMPTVPASFVVGRVLVVMIIALGILLPLFGLSLLLLLIWEALQSKRTALETGAVS